MATVYSRTRLLLLATLSSLVGLILGIILAEWGFRLYLGPTESTQLQKRFSAGVNQRSAFVTDPELAYRPRQGEGGKHNKLGVYPNEYDIDDRQGRTRVLFVGDSVTSRGKIIEALEDVYGTTDYEYWNAGVGGYSTSQELRYYIRYNRPISADLVVLTFHNNDFWTTGAILRNERGRLVTHPSTRADRLPGSWWLMDRSRIVQWLVYRELMQAIRTPPALDEIEKSLVTLRDAVEADGAVFRVVLHPSLAPWGEWTKRAHLSREKAIEIFERQSIPYFDLLQPMQSALTDGVDIQSSPGDIAHPSPDASKYFAAFLKENQLFDLGAK